MTDPISAIAKAAGDIGSSLFDGISSIWTSSNQKKIAQQQRLIAEEMTAQELTRYYQLVQDGNNDLASQLLEQVQSKVDSQNMIKYITVAGIMITVIVIILSKRKK